MGERTSHDPGTFSWTDLGTDDAEGAKAFYGELFGWRLEDNPVPDAPPYSMAFLDGKAVCAIYERREGQGPTAWLSYVTVEDADATAARAAELGATVISEPFDVMTAGRMAVLQDPTGAVFAIWQPGESIGAELVNEPGAMTINQLNTGDPEAAERFYSELFGWRFEDLAEGKSDGSGDQEMYWGVYNGDRLNGGMMPLEQAGPGAPPAWVVFFNIDDLDGAVARARELGGGVMLEPTAIGAGRIAVAHDPQNGVFALFEGEVDD
jgi:predicted enzyme related to lactoylglutathione lyase